MSEYKRGESPADWEAAARVQSHPAKRALKGLNDTIREMEANPELAEVNEALNNDLKSKGLFQETNPCAELVPVNENVLGINIIHQPKEFWPFKAEYSNGSAYSLGSTPYMAVRNLIDAYNTTEFWERHNAQKA